MVGEGRTAIGSRFIHEMDDSPIVSSARSAEGASINPRADRPAADHGQPSPGDFRRLWSAALFAAKGTPERSLPYLALTTDNAGMDSARQTEGTTSTSRCFITGWRLSLP